MGREEEIEESWIPQPWMLPLLVVVLVVPTFLGFAFGGTALGSTIAALTLVALIVVAVRAQHRRPIRFRGDGGPAPVVVLILEPIDDGRAAGQVAVLAESYGTDERGEHQVLLLSPARADLVQRWLSDTDEARILAQERLAVSLATLAAAGVHGEGRVVDEDPVQAIEDIAAQHGASRLAVVVERGSGDRLLAELSERVDGPLDRIEV